jgi:hypothetical protein
MSTLVLDERQSQLVATSDGSVNVVDANGRIVGTLRRADESEDEPIQVSPEELQELIRRMSMKDIQWKTTAEVLADLNRLAPE